MSGTVILVIVLAVLAVAGAAVLLMRGGLGRPGAGTGGRDLRRRFGPEYDRLAEERGDPKAVEHELAERVRARDELTLRPLEQDERERYTRAWTGVQERFVDDPRGAAAQADQVIAGLLTALGYPSQDPARQLDLASVDHARALADYRKARALMDGAAGTDAAAPTEDLRKAVLYYRVMFDDLLEHGPSERVGAGR
jgi:hypothetical protein